MTPHGDAVSLIHRYPGNLDISQPRAEHRRPQPFRAHVQQLDVAASRSPQDRLLLRLAHTRVDGRGLGDPPGA